MSVKIFHEIRTDEDKQRYIKAKANMYNVVEVYSAFKLYVLHLCVISIL